MGVLVNFSSFVFLAGQFLPLSPTLRLYADWDEWEDERCGTIKHNQVFMFAISKGLSEIKGVKTNLIYSNHKK